MSIDHGFKPAQGPHYTKFFQTLHKEILFDWYMEIGCRDGRSFALARGNTIAVDPFFKIGEGVNIIGVKPSLTVIQKTSDEFFSSRFLDVLGARLSFSFLDGMHLIEYLLRDIIGTERASKEEGVIAIHDICPFNHDMIQRDHRKKKGREWTGDVWKILPIIQEYRPDLKVDVLDAAPTGLLLLSSLDPRNNILQENYNEIIKRYGDLEMEKYGIENFNSLFDYQSTADWIAGEFGPFRDLSLNTEEAHIPKYASP